MWIWKEIILNYVKDWKKKEKKSSSSEEDNHED